MRTYLHSTMVLLVRQDIESYLNNTTKFTFHYGSISTKWLGDSSSALLSFTFHYGSISTIKFDYVRCSTIIFTFHYGSISTPLQVGSETITIDDLHSTMVLLVH